MFNIILAIDKNNLVGDNNGKYGLPWHYPEDLQFYKQKTTNQKCIMGRRTYEQIGRALPNRQTIVMSRDSNLTLDDAIVINDITELSPDENYFICGGVNIFNQFWNMADYVYVTKIDDTHDGDVYFNDIDFTNYTLVESKCGENEKLTFEKWKRNEN